MISDLVGSEVASHADAMSQNTCQGVAGVR